MDGDADPAFSSSDARATRAWLIDRISQISGLPPERIDPTLPFTAFGISSTDAVSLSGEIEERFDRRLPATVLYEYPSVERLTGFLAHQSSAPGAPARPAAPETSASVTPCVVGMACRFPGGSDPDEFWASLVSGADLSTTVPADRWDAARHYSTEVDTPGTAYTTRGAFVPELTGFDAEFFDISPAEALRMDPRQRMLLEVTMAALEDAGIAADRLRGTATGVFVGAMSDSSYTTVQVEADGGACLDDPSFGIGAGLSVLAGRLSYLLDLHGPSLVVDTACSSSLVAAHLAMASLRRGEIDLAIVGGVSAVLHPDTLRQGSRMRMLAPDGRCKTFDAAADGFLIGEGCGVIVLERAEDAVGNGHRRLALLTGSAVNQDGRSNGLTAPNPESQVDVIRSAQRAASVSSHEIGYVEAHGSGTLLGDAAEMAALQQVFGPGRDSGSPLLVGAVKTNLGHLLGAAGMAGLFKAVLAVRHGAVPGNLHLRDRNPTIDWDRCPTLLPDRLTPWPAPAGRRIAGVSSFGWSGTNSHVIVEAPPPPPSQQPSGPRRENSNGHLVLLSARTARGVERMAQQLLHRLREPGMDLADLAFTTQEGRSAYEYRVALPCHDLGEARAGLAAVVAGQAPAHTARGAETGVGFLLPGTGVESSAGQRLYEANPAFRAAVDECAEIASGLLGADLRRGFASPERPDQLTGPEPQLARAVAFAVDYAGAQVWRHHGIEPVALVGWGVGEYVAANLAGALPLETALLLAIRNAPGEVDTPQRRADLTPLVMAAQGESLRIPIGRGSSGVVLPAGRRVPPQSWLEPVHQPASARPMVDAAVAAGASLLVEVAPGDRLASEIRSSLADLPQLVAAGPPAPTHPAPEHEFLLRAVGELWTRGVRIDWARLRGRSPGRIVPLPTYPFAHTRYWPEPAMGPGGSEHPSLTRPRDATPSPVADWCYVPQWRRRPLEPFRNPASEGVHLLFADEAGVAERLAHPLRDAGLPVITVRPGDAYERHNETEFTIDPREAGHYRSMLRELAAAGQAPDRVVHAAGLREAPWQDPGSVERVLDRGFLSLMLFLQAMHECLPDRVLELLAVSNNAMDVLGPEATCPEQSTLWGLCRSGGHEYRNITFRYVDLELSGERESAERAAESLLREISLPPETEAVSWRNGARWVRSWEPPDLGSPPAGGGPVWRQEGVYVITGGTGGLGLALARHLADTVRARLVLISRHGLPARAEWDSWLRAHDSADPVSERIRAVTELEHAGGQVLVCAADCADPAGLRSALDEAVARFGTVHGVIHAAGVPGGGLLQTRNPAEVAAVLRPKLAGTLVLDAAVRDLPLDFIALYSSSVVAFGGLGESDYCAANAFLDAFAGSVAGRAGNRVLSISWGPWKWDSWQREALGDAELARTVRDYRDRFGITDAQGVEVLTRLLSLRLPHVLVLPQGLAATEASMSALLSGTRHVRPPRQTFPRPQLRTPYVAPGTAAEVQIAAIWREYLGLEQVGIHDPFFELGGNSLVGLAIVAQIERELRIELSAATLIERPTIAELAKLASGEPEADQLAGNSARGQNRRQRANLIGNRRRRQDT